MSGVDGEDAVGGGANSARCGKLSWSTEKEKKSDLVERKTPF